MEKREVARSGGSDLIFLNRHANGRKSRLKKS
jgi:hypothetical protein